MKERLAKLWLRVSASPIAAGALAFMGGIFYLLQAVDNAHHRMSFLDEGLYLYKGYLFASGRYQPFQEYGPWTNQMPLSFLIPGVIQVLFGPGLREGRYFAIALALLMLLGLWIVTRRLAGRWWAAGVVWALALNVASVKMYTLALSQGIVACLVAWILALTLGEDRPTWQVALGSALAGALVLVRVDLLLLLPLLILYIFWQHGKTKGVWGLAAGVLVLVVGHWAFWPGILALWEPWLPKRLTPWLEAWRLGAISGWRVETGLDVSRILQGSQMPQIPQLPLEQILYFFMILRLHPLSLGGMLAAWALWPGFAKNWPRPSQFRVAVFLSVLMVTLLTAYMYVAFVDSFCVSCILSYVTFFDYLGLVLLATSYSALRHRLRIWQEMFILIGTFVAFLGIGFSAYEDVGAGWSLALTSFGLGYYLLNVPINYASARGVTFPYYFISRVVASVYGWALLWLVVFASAVAVFLWLRRKRQRTFGPSLLFLNACLILALLFSQSVVLTKGNNFFACEEEDVLAYYERAGAELQKIIPPGSQVFWMGRIPAMFLYLPDVEVYPPLLNHYHSFQHGGDPDNLYRLGRWNQELGIRWMQEADFIVVETAWFSDWVKEYIETSGMVELARPPRPEPCRHDSRLRVYIRE